MTSKNSTPRVRRNEDDIRGLQKRITAVRSELTRFMRGSGLTESRVVDHDTNILYISLESPDATWEALEWDGDTLTLMSTGISQTGAVPTTKSDFKTQTYDQDA